MPRRWRRCVATSDTATDRRAPRCTLKASCRSRGHARAHWIVADRHDRAVRTVPVMTAPAHEEAGRGLLGGLDAVTAEQ